MGFEGHGPDPDPIGGLVPQPEPQGGTRLVGPSRAGQTLLDEKVGSGRTSQTLLTEEMGSGGVMGGHTPPFRQKHGNGRSAHATKTKAFSINKNAGGKNV